MLIDQGAEGWQDTVASAFAKNPVATFAFVGEPVCLSSRGLPLLIIQRREIFQKVGAMMASSRIRVNFPVSVAGPDAGGRSQARTALFNTKFIP